MMFGPWGNEDETDSIRIIHRALDAGRFGGGRRSRAGLVNTVHQIGSALAVVADPDLGLDEDLVARDAGVASCRSGRSRRSGATIASE